jgi:hypothetical protein
MSSDVALCFKSPTGRAVRQVGGRGSTTHRAGQIRGRLKSPSDDAAAHAASKWSAKYWAATSHWSSWFSGATDWRILGLAGWSFPYDPDPASQTALVVASLPLRLGPPLPVLLISSGNDTAAASWPWLGALLVFAKFVFRRTPPGALALGRGSMKPGRWPKAHTRPDQHVSHCACDQHHTLGSSVDARK